LGKNYYKIKFIGIGAQKAGTSWLFNRLNQIEGFCLPYKKELHYFDRDSRYPSPNWLNDRLFKTRWKKKEWRHEAVRECFTALKELKFKKFTWLWKWFFSTYDDKWYLSLFNPFKGITGEITPSYSILDEEDIVKMQQLLPEVKIVLLLRNPIERAWSHYRFDHGKSVTGKGVDMIHLKHFILGQGQEMRNDYLNTIERYKKFFPSNQILIGFYDAISEQPKQLLKDVVLFLGGKAENIQFDQRLYEKANPSIVMEMPAEVRKFLNEKYAETMKKLSLMFPGYGTRWYDALKNPEKESMRQDNPLPPASIILG
jgi:hypothetical protein